MKFVNFTFTEHGDYVTRVIGHPFCEDTKGVVAVTDQGDIAGLLLFDRWTQTSAYMHIGVTKVQCLRGLLAQAMEYVFITCQCQMVFGLTTGNNVAVNRLAHRIGMQEILRMPHAYAPNNDNVLHRMTAAQCLFLAQDKIAA